MPEQQRVNLPGARSIPAVERMPAFQFWRHRRFSDRLMHLRGGALAWKSFQKWSLPYPREMLPKTPVTLAKTSFEDIDRPRWPDPAKFMYEVNLWVGSAGCFSPLHYDLADNFLVQLQGRTHLTLFSKDDRDVLYPNVGQALDHCSMVDVRRPDLERFPLFPKAQAYSAVLEAGDVIDIPRRWWHAVHSLDTAVSVNYGWGGIFDALREGAQMVWTPAGRQGIAGFLRGLRTSGDAK